MKHIALCILSLLLLGAPSLAQELDHSELFPVARNKPVSTGASGSAHPFQMGKPLSASVSKTLYLPPDMYGQWNVTGRLVESNAPEFFRKTAQDIWVLDRSGDAVILTNPVTGASAAINVDKVEGNEAAFHREGPIGRRRVFLEAPHIRVNGDIITGYSLNRIRTIKNGEIKKEIYGVYELEAHRISGARVQFKPEESFEEPDFEIEDIQLQSKDAKPR